jgi:VWFA-related protein
MHSIKCWPKTARPARLLPRILCFLLLLFPAVGAQSQSPAAQTDAAPQTTLRSQANVVLIPTLVKDHHGEILYGLQADDFIVEDDGVEQQVRLDEAPEGQPVSVVVAVQIGRRASYEFPRMRGLNTMLQPLFDRGNARVALLEFDSRVQVAQEFTQNPNLVAYELANLRPGNGRASILDAIDYSVNLLKKESEDRLRILLLISETRDHGSVLGGRMESIVTALGNTNVMVYTLAFSPSLSNILDTGRGNNINEMSPGPDLLAPMVMAVNGMRKNVPKTVAAMTGGEYELFETQKKFELRMNDFTNHLNSRYLLSITPKNPHPGLHQLRVRLRKDKDKDRDKDEAGTVLARTSYWAEKNAQ